MGTFFDHPPRQLVAGRSGAYSHWFGGDPAQRGVVPPGGEHPVHLLYDLDLRDPELGLARDSALSPGVWARTCRGLEERRI
jgi:hypothetical protein